MSNSGTSGVTPVGSAASVDPAVVSQSPSGSQPSALGGASMSTQISSMEELKKQAPALYHEMLLSVAYQMCSGWKRQQDRIAATMRKARQDQGGG